MDASLILDSTNAQSNSQDSPIGRRASKPPRGEQPSPIRGEPAVTARGEPSPIRGEPVVTARGESAVSVRGEPSPVRGELVEPCHQHLPIGLYVHIPFCLSKCIYCDFNTYEGIEQLIPAFIDALERETSLWAQRLNHPAISSIFFGGGTPSYIPAQSIQRLLTTIYSEYSVATDAEITLEANPDDVHREKLDAWQEAGVNRLSIGIQSFHDGTLASLSRRHNADTAKNAVHLARETGFDNLSIDLMFGLPLQSVDNWRTSLQTAIGLGTDHLSLYGLQIELGTPLHRNVATGATPMPDDDLAADMYEMAMDTLGDAGYHHYEISNWAQDGKESQHNLLYWLNQPYLGVGPGAHSSLHGLRFSNLKSPRRYIDGSRAWEHSNGMKNSIGNGELAIDFVETTTEAMSMSETMMLGMRLSEGVRFEDFEARFGTSIDEIYGDELNSLTALGLIEGNEDRIALTRKGKLLGNEVFERFILSEE